MPVNSTIEITGLTVSARDINGAIDGLAVTYTVTSDFNGADPDKRTRTTEVWSLLNAPAKQKVVDIFDAGQTLLEP